MHIAVCPNSQTRFKELKNEDRFDIFYLIRLAEGFLVTDVHEDWHGKVLEYFERITKALEEAESSSPELLEYAEREISNIGLASKEFPLVRIDTVQ